MKKQEENSIYRIEECAKGFIVQKRTETEMKNGFWFWKRTLIIFQWNNLDENGNHCNLINRKFAEIYPTLSKAKTAVEKFKKYPIYHY